MSEQMLSKVMLTVLLIGTASLAVAITPAEQAEIDAAAMVTGQVPAVGAPVPHPDANGAGRAVVYFSDFEADNGGLAPTLDWEWGTFAFVAGAGCSGSIVPPAAPYSGSNMWGSVLNDCYNGLGNNGGFGTCANDITAADSVLMLTIDLSGYTDAQLSWWEWLDLYMDYDWGEVYVDGTVVFQHCGTGYTAPTAWVQQVVDLTPYVGSTVTIEFHQMASTVVNYSGWYIDDLEVTGTPVPVELQSFSVE